VFLNFFFGHSFFELGQDYVLYHSLHLLHICYLNSLSLSLARSLALVSSAFFKGWY
jgi:hypothetical protein